MPLLDKIGLGQKKPKPVGNTLEKGKGEQKSLLNRNFLEKFSIVLGLVLLTLLAFPSQERYEWLSVQVGEVWRGEDVSAPFDFPIYRSDQELETLKNEVRSQVEPLFVKVENARNQYLAKLDSLDSDLKEVLETYYLWQVEKNSQQFEQAQEDSSLYFELRNRFKPALSDAQWRFIIASFQADMKSNSEATSALSTQLLKALKAFSFTTEGEFAIDLPQNQILTEDIQVLDEQTRIERPIAKAMLIDQEQVRNRLRTNLRNTFGNETDTLHVGINWFNHAFVPDFRYNLEETKVRWEVAEQSISPTRDLVKKDQNIIRKGEIVTGTIKAQLMSLGRIQVERSGNLPWWQQKLGQLLLVISIYLIFLLYLFLFRKQIFERNRHVLLISMLFAIQIGLVAIVIAFHLSPILIPFAVFSITLTVVFDSRVGLIGTLTLGLLAGLLLGNDYQTLFLAIFGGSVAVYSVRDVKNRRQIIITAGLVFFSYLITISANSMLHVSSWQHWFYELIMVSINVVLLLLTYPLIWIVEKLFDVTTDLTLLELSDTNTSLLKELSITAPGTFNHSLQVANMAEAASDAIGANALLARVGALYHDIGKMDKPEYFIENQHNNKNPHDHLTPRMSAMIICSHVKEGLVIAKQYRLPKPIVDFIPMHHGTMRVEYFYRKALEENGDNVFESDFRYPGPRPTTAETAILMLADGVEAASKSLDKPNYKKLDTLIEKIIKARMEDGQLDYSPLTFADLHKIKDAFLTILSGMYHVRIKYPEQKQEKDTDATQTVEIVVEDAPENPPEAPIEPDTALEDPSTIERAGLD